MKKIIIAALTLILILGVCVFPAAAAGSGSLSITGAEGKQGDTVTVAVNLNSNPGLITMKFAVSYPSDLELLSVQNSGLLGGWTTPAPTISSPYTIRWADSLATANNTATGKIITLTFKIKESATTGNKTVSLTFNESRDANGGKNTFENASATVKVTCKSHSFGGYSRIDDTQHRRTCSVCNYAEKTNHSWDNGTVNKKPNCKEAGEKTYTCSACNATKKETLPKTSDHNYSAWSKLNDTTHNRTCSVCQKVETAGHNWNGGTITKPASCKEAGEKVFACSTCSASKMEPIAKLTTHTYSNWTKVNDATHKHTCSVCAKEEAANHSWNSGAVTKKATCKEAGIKTYTCTGCNATKTETLAKLTTHTYDHACDANCNICGLTRSITHSYKSVWSTDKAVHWHECSVCKDKKDSAAHTPGAEATETTAQTCTICSYIIKPALGHKHSYATKWTTDDKGHWYACSGCEEKGSYAGHTWNEGKVTKEATETEIGIKAYTCTVCNATKEEELDMLTPLPTTEPSVPNTTEPDATEPASTTPADTGKDTPSHPEGQFPWWIILIVVIVVGGGIAAFVIIKKKKN